ncbi:MULTISPECIES: hypothetical protein [unclassified Rathayibacter]|uniref:hypothetical protein n=1 Tax=unclassified Rathayibacter TaxID=2609250 RepID=UPI0006F9EC93|nr:MULTISPECIES: hypothetical protein [unclassified Rathayibacter]KQQ06164.1 hypothetical protein ASF42_06515 [Rathayibacter sp. Leaf294]KQS14021.1 hypothetical protein ASG06_06525 [Rathayibacter sp. Leaf185]
MIGARRRWTGALGVAAAALLALSACTAGPAGSTRTTPAAEPAPTATAATTATPDAAPAAEQQSAEDGFREWLDASRAPDAALACARLSPELAARMVAEMKATGPVQVASCEDMITATAELYRATGRSAEVDIDVREETATDATLFVTYASGDCGTVVMTRSGTTWIITEQSQECAA